MYAMQLQKYRWLTVITLSFIICHLSFSPVGAQTTDRQYIRQGNKLFRSGDYANAEVSYRKAIEKNPKNPQAVFNLGNALMAQKKDSAAVMQFDSATKLETNPLRKAKAYHNVGVICQSHKMYGEAIEAYKSALRLNPADDETRYNLVLCKHQQKKQQQNQQQNQQGNNDQKKDDQKDQQNKDQQQEKQDDKKQQEQPKQDKLKKAQQQPQRRTTQKNW